MSLKKINQELINLENQEKQGVIDLKDNTTKFIVAIPLVIVLLTFAKKLTGARGDKWLDGVIELLQALSSGTYLLIKK